MAEPILNLAPNPTVNGKFASPGSPRRRSTPPWRRRRVILACLGVLLVLAVALARLLATPTPPPVVTSVAVGLLAHGQVTPARQARVGTQTGGVVQQLNTAVGTRVAGQTPLAWVRGPSGTEVVTAPFAGTLTNVLVHEGDTVPPAATLAVVADLQSLQVETTDVDEFIISRVTVDQIVQVSVDALDNRTLPGKVLSVAMLPEPSSISTAMHYPVTISLESVPTELRAGMSVRILFPS
jgi:multidrug efflux pump subunit AcrA (membrane-fusion protein)